jgi:peptidoglycan/LPS O-acetylase OafA/YrhL
MLRGFAALYVAVGHIFPLHLGIKGTWLALPFAFGQEAVILFFLISGFVIQLSAENDRSLSPYVYFWKRVIRIYPIFVLAGFVGYIFGCVLSGVAPTPTLKDLIGNVGMLQDFSYGKPGVFVAPLGGNTPLWSLSYEWWFYMAFIPMYWVIPEKYRMVAVLAVSTVATLSLAWFPGPFGYFGMYFILWWGGAELARVYLINSKISLRPLLPALSGITLVVLLWVIFMAAGKLGPVTSAGLHPVLELRHLLSGGFLMMVALGWSRFQFKGFDILFGKFEKVGAYSYGLYALHYPLGATVDYLHWIPTSLLRSFAYLGISMLAAWAVEKALANKVSPFLRNLFLKTR